MEKRLLKDLIPYDKNPRNNKAAVDKVLESLNRHGQVKPIVVSEKGKPFDQEVICAGHTTMQALKRFGAKDAFVVVKAFADEAQFVDYNIRDNKVAEFAEWDEALLGELAADFDIDLKEMEFEFDVEEEAQEGLTDEDEVPEAPEEPTAKLGQIWKLGDHRLMCGDSTDRAQVEALMDGEKADMVFTDPPYGVSYSNNMNDKHEVIMNDDKFLTGWIPLVDEFSCGFIFMWTSYQVVGKWIELTKPFGDMTNLIVWSKGGGGLGDLKGAFATDYELALVWNRGAKLQDKRIGSVWSVGKDNGSEYKHPTQKPVELMEKGIFNCSKYKNIVMDLFLGSGSTLIACEKINRRCYGMELDPKYCDVIIKRFEDFSGKKAELMKDAV